MILIEIQVCVGSWEMESRKLRLMEELGASLDWSRDRFTMSSSSESSKFCLYKADGNWVDLHRGKQLVNWSPELRSAIS